MTAGETKAFSHRLLRFRIVWMPEMVEKARRAILRSWYWWAWLCGTAGLAYMPAWIVVSAFMGHNPVSIHTDQRLLTPRVSIGEDLVFAVTVDRKRPCKGNVVDVFEAVGRGIQVIRERPIISNTVESHRILRIGVPLPPSIPSGPARFKSSLVSDCPEGAVIDAIIDTTLMVVDR